MKSIEFIINYFFNVHLKPQELIIEKNEPSHFII